MPCCEEDTSSVAAAASATPADCVLIAPTASAAAAASVAALMEDARKGANARLTIDLPAQTVTSSDGQVFHFEIDPFRKHCLVNGLDDIGLTMEKAPAIAAYEAKLARLAVVAASATWRLEMGRRSLGDYPRGLVIDVDPGDGTWRVLVAHEVLPGLGASFAREPRTPAVDVALPPNQARRLRLHTTGQTRTWFWVIDELRVWRR